MENKDGALAFDVLIRDNNLEQMLSKDEQRIAQFTQNVESNSQSVVDSFGSIGRAVGGIAVGAMLKSWVTDIVNVRGEFQQLEIAFTTMLGSAEKSAALMRQVTDTAATTPFDLKGVANGAKQLLAYGESAETVNGTLVRLGNIASGLSLPLNDLVYLYGTTMVQGRLFTQDVRQFMGRGIPLVQELSKMLGKTTEEINQMVTDGKIGFPEVQKVIESLTNSGGMFFNLMEEQSKSLTGQIANLGDAWDMMLNEIGQSNEGILSSGIGLAATLVENYEDVAEALGVVIGLYGTYKASIIAVAALQRASTHVAYEAETKILAMLIPMKEEYANAEMRATLMTKGLTQAEADKVMMLRAEAKANLEVMAVEAEKAAAGVRHAKQAIIDTRLVLYSKQQAILVAKEELAVATASGNAKKILAKQTQLDTAITEKNAAVRDLRAKKIAIESIQENAQAKIKALNTAQTQLDTVSNITNTASVGVLIVAKTKLTAVVKRLYATLIAHPFALATAAVVALGYGIYKLITHQTEAEKAQKRLNETTKEFNKTAAAEQAEIDRLFDKLRNTTKETANYQKVKDEIISKYGSYLDGLNKEIKSLRDIEAAYKAISVAARQSAIDRAIATATKDAQDSYAEQVSEINNNLKEALYKKMNKGAADAFLETINRELENTGRLSDDTRKKLEQFNYTVHHLETGEVIGSGNSAEFWINKLNENKKNLDAAYNDIRQSFGVSVNEYEGLAEEQVDTYISAFEKAIEAHAGTGKSQTIKLFDKEFTFESIEELNLHLSKLKDAKTFSEQAQGAKTFAEQIQAAKSNISTLESELANLKKGINPNEDGSFYDFVTGIEGKAKELKEAKAALNTLMGSTDSSSGGKNTPAPFGSIQYWESIARKAEEVIAKTSVDNISEIQKQQAIKQEAEQKAEEIRQLIAKRSLDEEIEYTKQQYELYYRWLTAYGEEEANKQFAGLISSGSTYTEWLQGKINALETKQKENGITKTEGTQLITLKTEMDVVTGVKTEMDKFTESISKAKEQSKSLSEYMAKLASMKQDLLQGKIGLIGEERATATNQVDEEIQRNSEELQRQLLETYRTNAQLRLDAEKQYEDEIYWLRQNGFIKQAELAEKAKAKTLAEIDATRIQGTDGWKNLFENAAYLSSSAFDEIVNGLRKQVEAIEDVDIKKALIKQLDGIEEQTQGSKNPFKQLVKHIREYKKAGDDVSKQKNLIKVFGDIASSVDMVKASFDAVVDGLNQMGLAGDENTQSILSDISGLMGGVSDLAAGYASMNPAQMIQGAVGVVTNAISLFDSSSRRIKKEMKEHEKQLGLLQRAYDQIQFDVENAVGNKYYEEQAKAIANLKDQIKENQELARLEQSKKSKDRDDNKVQEYLKAAEEGQREIIRIQNEITDTLVQTNFRDLASDLADAWTDAFGDMEKSAESFDEVWKNTVANAVKNALKMSIIEEEVKSFTDALSTYMKGNNYSASGFNFDYWKQKLKGAGDAFTNALQEFEEYFQDVADDITDDSTLEGQVKSITEETGSKLAGEITAMRIRQVEYLLVSKDIRATTISIQGTLRDAITHLNTISVNTSKLSKLDEMSRFLQEMRDTLNSDSLRAKGYNI